MNQDQGQISSINALTMDSAALQEDALHTSVPLPSNPAPAHNPKIGRKTQALQRFIGRSAYMHTVHIDAPYALEIGSFVKVRINSALTNSLVAHPL